MCVAVLGLTLIPMAMACWTALRSALPIASRQPLVCVAAACLTWTGTEMEWLTAQSHVRITQPTREHSQLTSLVTLTSLPPLLSFPLAAVSFGLYIEHEHHDILVDDISIFNASGTRQVPCIGSEAWDVGGEDCYSAWNCDATPGDNCGPSVHREFTVRSRQDALDLAVHKSITLRVTYQNASFAQNFDVYTTYKVFGVVPGPPCARGDISDDTAVAVNYITGQLVVTLDVSACFARRSHDCQGERVRIAAHACSGYAATYLSYPCPKCDKCQVFIPDAETWFPQGSWSLSMWVARDYPPLEDVDSAIFSVRGTGAPSVTVATSRDDHLMLGYSPSSYVSTPQAWPLDLFRLHHFAATFADSGEANMYYGKTPFDVALQWEVLNVSIDAGVIVLEPP